MEISEYVKSQLKNDETFELAKAYAGLIVGGEKIFTVCLTGYEQVVEVSEMDLETFSNILSLEQFMYTSLEQEGKILDAESFESEEQAEKEGFYWYENYDSWVHIS